MDSFPTELIYALIFGAILLLQYLMKRFGPQEQQDSARQQDLPEIPGEVMESPAASPVFSVDVGHFGRTEAPSASPLLPERRFSRRSLMGTRREVQNAIVIATILGPCRTFEPHDTR